MSRTSSFDVLGANIDTWSQHKEQKGPCRSELCSVGERYFRTVICNEGHETTAAGDKSL
jgi:hypothetical protein